MTARVVVREATAGDLPAVGAVYLRSWRAAYEGLLPPDVLDAEAEGRRRFDWAGEVAAPDTTVLVAVDAHGTVRGVAEAADGEAPDGSRRPMVVMLYVEPSAWGTGVAGRLLAAATAWLSGRGHRQAWLRVVGEHPRARRFYEREGWVRADDVAAGHNGLVALVPYRRDVGPGPAPGRRAHEVPGTS